VAEGAPEALLQGEHNGRNDWQGGFRVGWFDLVMARHALAAAGGVDGLALTCLDRLRALPWVGLVESWTFLGEPAEVADLFEMDGRRVLAIRPDLSPSRARQERLTRSLARCEPVVRPLPSAQALLDTVERALSVPIVVRSWGANSGAKEVLF
jgi:adenylosuccinate synthase